MIVIVRFTIMVLVLVAVCLGFVSMVRMVVAVSRVMLMIVFVLVDMIMGVDVTVRMTVLRGAVFMGMIMFMAVLMIVIMGVLVFSLHDILLEFAAAICPENAAPGRALLPPFRFQYFLFTQSFCVKSNITKQY